MTNTVAAVGVLGVVLAGVDPQVAYGTFSGVLESGSR